MKIALGQINPTVGDLAANVDRMIDSARQAKSAGADLAVFPELAVSGYPPQDLVLRAAYLKRCRQELERLAAVTGELGIPILCGYPGSAPEDDFREATNSAAWLEGGKVAFEQRKMLLPTYDVFDEWRYFAPAREQRVFEWRGLRLGITVCEDAWNDKQFWPRPRYHRDPVEELSAQGIDLLINIAASPYHMHKRRFREEMIRSVARRHRVPVVMVNQVGGNDELLFDGSSFVMDRDGAVRAQAKAFDEGLIFYDTEGQTGDLRPQAEDECEVVYEALVVGLRDYVRKCGFSQGIVGLSGGIDSSLTAVIAADALGVENVMGVGMPGPYSSEGSVSDARALAEKLGIRFEVVSIQQMYESTVGGLEKVFAGRAPDVTEENIQARLRANVLMSLSNKFGALVLSTGNKSELAVGYCTLYGDMVGGVAVISDVPKTLVYQVARVANRRHREAIPESVFTKPPSAELRPDQKDSDSLPAYEVLDPVLKLYIEDCVDPGEIAERLQLDAAAVREITRMVDRNEYKRKQAAPGLRVTSKAFGMGRRYPIAQRFSP